MSGLTFHFKMQSKQTKENYMNYFDMPYGEAIKPLPEQRHIRRYIALKLSAMGLPAYHGQSQDFQNLMKELLRNHREKDRQLSDFLAPVDTRIQNFLNEHLKDVLEDKSKIKLPSQTFVLDQPGLARELSLPAESDHFKNDYVDSYRVRQGVLHNPRHDRRTTKGVFHVTEGGLPIPPDKRSVPKKTFAKLLEFALQPPSDLATIPFMTDQEKNANAIVSLMLRPTVVPEIPGKVKRKTMEVRFFAPGSLVSNLDFVESIFGNGGDPILPENDAALDPDSWTGHTGCVILAPHLNFVKKIDVGLPHKSKATERQIRDEMYYEDPEELYNEGSAFKVTCRTDEGIMVTLIADNYFGYCKKEVKTQISYSANLYGLAEEEHAGGAIAFPSYHLGDTFRVDSRVEQNGEKLEDVLKRCPNEFIQQPEGHAIHRDEENIYLIPLDATISLTNQKATWKRGTEEFSIQLSPEITYMLPTGYKVRMEKHPSAPTWRLVGTSAIGTFCHKPCTVSGGGKSEISKSIQDFMLFGPVIISDFEEDMAAIEKIVKKDYGNRFPAGTFTKDSPSRPLLSPDRSLGSVIKLLTPSPDYTDEYNNWLESIPDRYKAIIYYIKRFYREEWGDDWKSHFTADYINGKQGHELKFGDRKLVGSFLRIGFLENGVWRTFKLRQDFIPAEKVQMEDDISASIVIPSEWVGKSAGKREGSIKVLENCEARLFQRPDEAIHRGMDKQTEFEMSQRGNFLSNYEPLDKVKTKLIAKDVMGLHEYTDPMRDFVLATAEDDNFEYASFPSHPRIVDGKPTKNPRFLQLRPDVSDLNKTFIQNLGLRLYRSLEENTDAIHPVDSVLGGRRNNPPDKGVRPLAVYNPIHYQELPELFMDFICSLTGKSPSTTGAGSEGALTKAPFNALHPTTDLNNAFLSYILTGQDVFTTAAGFVGPKYQVDHDVSLLIPEIWCRMSPKERKASFLIQEGCFERVKDFEHDGKLIKAGRLGYRMTEKFQRLYLGRIFDSPHVVFTEEMLKPELQDMDCYVDGVLNITEAQQWVAEAYITFGGVKGAIPPIQALLHIMAEGTFEGMTENDPELRKMFDRETVLKSDWFLNRLDIKRERDLVRWKENKKYLETFYNDPKVRDEAEELKIAEKIEMAQSMIDRLSSANSVEDFTGTFGADPIYRGDDIYAKK